MSRLIKCASSETVQEFDLLSESEATYTMHSAIDITRYDIALDTCTISRNTQAGQ